MRSIVAQHDSLGRVLILCFLPGTGADDLEASAICVRPTGRIVEVAVSELTVERPSADFALGYPWSIVEREPAESAT